MADNCFTIVLDSSIQYTFTALLGIKPMTFKSDSNYVLEIVSADFNDLNDCNQYFLHHLKEYEDYKALDSSLIYPFSFFTLHQDISLILFTVINYKRYSK